jgi:hypothetical protein
MKRSHTEAESRRSCFRPLAIFVILLLFSLAVTVAGSATAASAQSLRDDPQEQGPECQSCHAAEYDLWKNSTHAGASLDPAFQEQLNQAHNQEECLTCHAAGVQADSGESMAGGVSCEACHGPYQEGHTLQGASEAASATMILPVESSAVCRTCHEAVFSEWDTTKHAERNIECFDCHLAHTQGLRTGSVDTLCAACHSDEGTQAAHSRHGINGVDCTSCHMAEQMTSTAAGDAGAQISASSHSFEVTADVCNQCHASTIHSTGAGKPPGELQISDTQIQGQSLSANEKGLEELRAEISSLQARLASLRDAAVIGIGLGIGLGGFMGLVIGLVGMSLWLRSRRSP